MMKTRHLGVVEVMEERKVDRLDEIATPDGTNEQFEHSIQLPREPARKGGLERTTNLRSLYLLMNAGLHDTAWSHRAGVYVADPRHFTVRVNDPVTVHIYVRRDQRKLTSETKIANVTAFGHCRGPGGLFREKGGNCGGWLRESSFLFFWLSSEEDGIRSH